LRAADLVLVYASPFDSAVSAAISPYLMKKAARTLYVWQEGATTYLGPTVIADYTPCTRFPEMRRHNYSDRLAAAVVSVGGTLAVVVPPSIVLVFYGVLTETSIGKLFIAGIIPGLLTACGLAVVIKIIAQTTDHRPQTTDHRSGSQGRTLCL
jgi:TRAP-type mannitol/chloroaromatic compound transport system permease large subunit